MGKNITLMILCMGAVLLLGKNVAFSQTDTIRGGMVPEYGADQEVLWLWGPVVSVDSQNNQVMVKYFDYENDQEKEMTLTIDEKTSFENVRSLGDIKINDALSIDYIASVDGKNIARNLSVEKPEEPILPTEAIVETGSVKNKKE